MRRVYSFILDHILRAKAATAFSGS